VLVDGLNHAEGDGALAAWMQPAEGRGARDLLVRLEFQRWSSMLALMAEVSASYSVLILPVRVLPCTPSISSFLT
jgi:hypothetical protein